MQRGEVITIWANGLGPVAAGGVDGLRRTLRPVVVVAGSREIALEPLYAGLTPGGAGVFQVNVVLPAEVEPGASVPLYLRVMQADGREEKSNVVTIAIDGEDRDR